MSYERKETYKMMQQRAKDFVEGAARPRIIWKPDSYNKDDFYFLLLKHILFSILKQEKPQKN